MEEEKDLIEAPMSRSIQPIIWRQEEIKSVIKLKKSNTIMQLINMSQQMVCYSQPSGGINLGILLGKKGRHF